MMKKININLFLFLFTLLFYSPLHSMEKEDANPPSMKNLPNRQKIEEVEDQIKKFGDKIPDLAFETEPEKVKELAGTFNSLGQLYIDRGDEYIKIGDQSEAANSYNEAALFYNYVTSMIKNNAYLDNLNQTIKPYDQLDSIQRKLVKSIGENKEKLEKLDPEQFPPYKFLINLRHEVKEKIEHLDKSEETYIKKSKALFFEIAQKMKEFLAQLYQKAEEVVGKAPCDYAIIGLGSLALTQMTPYSDLEFAILMEDKKDKDRNQKHKDHFKKLSQLVHFYVINLGETIISPVKYCDTRHLVKKAVNFDLGEKTPLGSKEKHYELICTVDEMLKYMYNKDQKSEHIDTTLPYILQKTCFVHGNKGLFEEYNGKVKEFLKNHGESRAVKMLSEGCTEIDYINPGRKEHKILGNIKQFAFNAKESSGRIFNIKQEIYRLPDRFIYNLGLIHGIDGEDNWDTITQLAKQKVINKTAETNLKQVLAFAANLRLKAYSHYGYHKDEMDCDEKHNDLDLDQRKKLIKQYMIQTFKLNNEDLQENGALYEYYYITIPLTKKLTEFCMFWKRLTTEGKKDFFLNERFYNDSDVIKSEINLRLFRIEQALTYQKLELQKLIKEYGEDSPIIARHYNSVGSNYMTSGDYREALKYFEKALKTKINKTDEYLDLFSNTLDSSSIYNNLGLIWNSLGDYKKSYDYFLNARNAQTLQNRSVSESNPNDSFISIYNNLGLNLLRQGNFEEGSRYTEKSLIMSENIYGKNHPSTAQFYNNHGCALMGLCREEALRYLNESLNIRKRIFGENHSVIAESYYNIGEFYRRNLGKNTSNQHTGEYNKVFENYKNAIDVLKKKLGKDHPDLSYVYKQITLLYNDLNKYEDALKYCKKELRIRKKQLGQDHPDTAENNAIMANLLNKLEHPSKALFYCKKALNVMEKLRRKHPNIEVAYHFMSDILYNLGEYDQALDYLRKELEIIEKKLGKGHYTTARCYNAMGNILSHQGKDEEAFKNYKEALRIGTTKLNENDIGIAESYSGIAATLCRQKKYEEALEFSSNALKIKEKLEEGNVTANIYDVRGEILAHLNNYPEALDYFERAKKIREDKLGKDHSNTAASYHIIGSVLEKMHRYGEALNYCEKGLQIRKKKLGEDHPDTASSYAIIAEILYKLKRPSEALIYCEKTVSITEKKLNNEHPKIARTYHIMAEILGNCKEALGFCIKALESSKKLGEEGRTAAIYNTMGVIFMNLNEDSQALEVFKKAKEIAEEQLERNYSNIATSYQNIGSVLKKMHRYGEALSHQIKAFNIFLKMGLQVNLENESFTICLGNISKTFDTIQYESKAKALDRAINDKKHFYLRDWGEMDTKLANITIAIAPTLNWISKNVLKDNKVKNKIKNICTKYNDKNDQEIVKMLCFEAICLGVADGNLKTKKPLDCLKQFCKENLDLVIKIAKIHPEYFVDKEIINKCVHNFPEELKSLEILL
mgnify:CR=1 FL=1